MGKTQISNNSTLAAVHRTVAAQQAGGAIHALKAQGMQQQQKQQQQQLRHQQKQAHTPVETDYARSTDPLAPLRRGLATSGLLPGASLFGTMFDMPPEWLASCTPARRVARMPAAMRASNAPATSGGQSKEAPSLRAQPADADDWKKAVWVEFHTADKHHTFVEPAQQQRLPQQTRTKSASPPPVTSLRRRLSAL